MSLLDLAALPVAGQPTELGTNVCASDSRWAGIHGTGEGGCGKEEEMHLQEGRVKSLRGEWLLVAEGFSQWFGSSCDS